MADGVRYKHECGTNQCREYDTVFIVGRYDESGHMWRNKTNKANDSGKADDCRRQKYGYEADDESYFFRVDPQGAGYIIGVIGHYSKSDYIMEYDWDADDHNNPQYENSRPAGTIQGPEGPLNHTFQLPAFCPKFQEFSKCAK